MDFKTFFYKKFLMGFFIATTCICAAISILGLLFEPDKLFGYQGLLSPLIYGALTILPSLVTYSKHELTVRKMLIRKFLEFTLIEVIVLSVVSTSGTLINISLILSLMLSVLLIYITVNLILWVNDKKTAREFNKALLELQKNYEQDN